MKTSKTSKLGQSTKIVVLTLTALALGPASLTQAADIFWSGGTASYTNAANWGGTVPGTGDNAINNNGSNNVVQVNTGDPDWTVVDLQAGSVEATAGAYEQNGQTVSATGWIRLGLATNSFGSYTLNSGVLNVLGGRMFLSESEGSLARLIINGGVFNKTGDIFVLADGGWGGQHSGTATVVQNGGTINSSSEIWIGQFTGGNGTYDIHAGATINSSNWFVVSRAGAVGTLNMDGGVITQVSGGTPAFIVGDRAGIDGGVGTFNHSGGTVNCTSAEFWIGNGAATAGTNNMSGTAALNGNNWIAVGRGGIGVLNMSGGTITKTGGGNIVIGAFGGAIGIINQTGGAIVNTNSQVWIGENGTGTWNFNGGTATLGVVHIAQTASSVGTLNVNGAVMSASEITSGDISGFSTLVLNGATIQARTDQANFLHSLSSATIDAGGVTFDSQNFNIGINQGLGGAGGLTKNGTGTLSLLGVNSYAGPTIVNAGRVLSTTDTSGGGNYTVADGAGLGLKVQTANAQLSMPNLTLATSTGATLDFDLGPFGNPTAAPLSIAGTFAVNGTITVNIADALPQVGQFALIQFATRTGSGNFALGTIPVGVVANIVTNVPNNTIDLNITSVNLPRWDGQAGGNWDIGLTTNWINIGTGLPTFYGEGNFVLFDDNALGTTTVNLTANVNPGSVTFNNTNLNYTLVGSGRIGGPIGLSKPGTGTLALHNTGGNTYSGRTVISGGTLSVTNLANGGSPSPIGASSANPTNLVIGNATFSYAGAPVTINRGYSLASASSTIDVQGDLTLTGTVSPAANSGFIKTGPARLTYSGSGSNHLSGGANPGFRIVQGTVLFDGSAGQTNRSQAEFHSGNTPASGASLVLSNTTLINDSWFAVGRGNGSVGNTSTFTMYNSTLSANGISFGWWNNLAGNFSFQTVTLNGNSVLTNRGGNLSNVSESGGSTTTMNINDNSVFGSNPRLVIAGGGEAGAGTGIVTIANSGRLHVNSFCSIANGNLKVASVLVKDNGTFFVQTDLNASDTGSSTGTLTVQDNGTANGGTVFIGKAGTSVGNGNFLGGNIISRGNFRVGQASNSLGTVTMSGGTVSISGELWMGESGTGNWTQNTGDVWSTNWVAIGRNAFSTGVYTISGGSITELDPNDRFIVAANGTGTLTMSGTAQVASRGAFQVAENAPAIGTVNLNGGTLTAPRVFGGAGMSTFNFNGGTLVAGNAADPNFMSTLTTASVLSGGAIIDSGANVININQALLDGTGGGGLTKNGTGTLRLNGANTYTGATVVNAGSLGGTGTIPGPVSFASGSTLAPGTSIGTLTINNTLTLAAGSTTFAEVSVSGGVTNDQVAGLTGVTYGGSLVVTNIGGGVLPVGTVFKLFASSSPGSGNFSTVTVLPFGAGTFNPSTGELTITSSGALFINPPFSSGGNLVLTGIGGTPGGSYTWLTSPDVAAPLSTWTTNSTGVFDGSGSFSNAIPINTSIPTRFFLLRTP